MLTVGSLFSGIGGLEIGLEMTRGFRTIWHSEIDSYCCEVLERHWPGIPNLGDITKIDWSTVERPDVICGGVPCQPASVAGKRQGVTDERWLWPAFFNAVRCLRPRIVIAENVPGILTVDGGLAFNGILSELAALRYDAEWAIVPAAAVGAPHRRERLFIVAYTASDGLQGCDNPRLELEPCAGGLLPAGPGGLCAVAYTEGERERSGREGAAGLPGREQLAGPESRCNPYDGGEGAMADAGCTERWPDALARCEPDGTRAGREQEAGGLAERGEAVGYPAQQLLDGSGSAGKGRRGEHPDAGRELGHAAHVGLQGQRPAGQQLGTAPCEQAAAIGAGGRIFRPIPRSTFWDEAEYIECGDGKQRAVGRDFRGVADELPAGLDGYAALTRLKQEHPDAPMLPLLETGQRNCVARLKALGNAVVPEVARYVGDCILRTLKQPPQLRVEQQEDNRSD